MIRIPPALTEPARRRMLDWYRREHRRLPWRAPPDGPPLSPYAVLVSELMLQQTRVDTVLEPYRRWMARWPTLAALAAADEAEVLEQWTGLGYYRRARHLHAAARCCCERHGGDLPRDRDALLELPGLGRYTAGAVCSIAFGAPEPLVDGNVARVLARWLALDGAAEVNLPRLWLEAGVLVSEPPACVEPGNWNQALMELGATVCTPRNPRCDACPVAQDCAALRIGAVERIPSPRVRAAPLPVSACYALVLRQATEAPGRAVLLGRRPEHGRWAGLWEPPGAEGPHAAHALAAWLDAAGLAAEGRLAPLVHVLTHRRYEVEAVWLRLRDDRVPDLAELGYVAARWLPLAQVGSATSGLSRLGSRLCEAATRVGEDS